MLRCWVGATCLVPALRGSGDKTRHPSGHNLEGLYRLRRAAEEALFHGREKQCGPHLLARWMVNIGGIKNKIIARTKNKNGYIRRNIFKPCIFSRFLCIAFLTLLLVVLQCIGHKVQSCGTYFCVCSSIWRVFVKFLNIEFFVELVI